MCKGHCSEKQLWHLINLYRHKMKTFKYVLIVIVVLKIVTLLVHIHP